MHSQRAGLAEASARRRGAFAEALAIGMAVAQGMRMTLRNFLRKPVTVHYPTSVRPTTDRFRGLLALTYDKETGEENCIGCRLCEFICPPAVIKVEMLKGEKRNYAKLFTLELYACEFCELCVQVCPTDAILMTRDLAPPAYTRAELFLSKERLMENGRRLLAQPELLSHATGTRLREWADAERGAG